MEATKDLDEGAFPCPIFAGERMHLASSKAEVDLAEHLDSPETFGDPSKLNHRRQRFQTWALRIAGAIGVSELP